MTGPWEACQISTRLENCPLNSGITGPQDLTEQAINMIRTSRIKKMGARSRRKFERLLAALVVSNRAVSQWFFNPWGISA